MPFPVRPEWSTASVGSSHAPTDAVDHSAPSAIRPESTYISGKVVQTNGATSFHRAGRYAGTKLAVTDNTYAVTKVIRKRDYLPFSLSFVH